MIRALAAAAVAAAAGTAPVAPGPMPPAMVTAATVRLPGFAAALAEQPFAHGPAAWPAIADADAWQAIAASSPASRQQARWAYAQSMIANDRAGDALGVLDVMVADDPDLALVPAWRRARGAALALLRRPTEAIAALNTDMLLDDAESCAWRMRVLGEAHQPSALGQLRCAVPAIQARSPGRQRPFLIAGAQAAIEAGRYRPALTWLEALPDDDVAANLWRGRALLAVGEAQSGRLRLERVLVSGTAAQRADARVTMIEGMLALHTMPAAEATRQLESLRFAWRGGTTEQRALRLSLTLATAAHDVPAALGAGAVLFRYFDLGAATAPLVATMQQQIVAALAEESTMPLDRSAGLFWQYRDLMPTGIDGDRIVESLTGRLQDAGLYARAADLLGYRLSTTVEDLQKGPLSVRIASLQILAGKPDQAVRVIRATDGIAFPPDMQADRRRIEAAALDLLGKPVEALAAIEDVADADGLRTEIYWRAHDWTNLVTAAEPALPAPRALSEVGQAIVLRQAIGLAMLGREDALARLHARYAAAFAALPTGATFTMLTARPGTADPAMLDRAMAALPSASPAGRISDLMEAGHAAMASPGS